MTAARTRPVDSQDSTEPDSAGTDSDAPLAAAPDFATLVDRHLGFVWRVLRRLGLSPADADDASQQVFMVAARKGVENQRTERAFLYATAIRVAANARRSLKRRREVFPDSFDQELHPTASPERHLELAQARALLDELLAQLPAEQARVLVLSQVEQMSTPAIAQLEGIPSGTAASRLRLARRAFRELLRSTVRENPFEEGGT